MIIVNGYISILGEDGRGFDDRGNPIVNPKPCFRRIPCNYVRNRYNGEATYTDGRCTDSSYTILIAQQRFNPCRFSLCDIHDRQLGEFDVHENGIVYLDAVGATQITV